MIKDEFYVMHNGVKIPKVGFGTWQNNSKEECIESVLAALRSGYTHIDTAAAYGNEEYIREAIELSGLKREDIFITSKLLAEKKGYEICKEELEKTLKRLGTDYIDLYLIHAPNPWDMDQNSMENMDKNIESWRAMEELYNEGKIRAIGISNFNPVQTEMLIANSKIVPMVNQVYCHVGVPNQGVLDCCNKHNIIMEAYCPLGTGRVLKNPRVIKVAEKYGVSTARLAIKWCLDLGTLPLPKSVHEEYIKSNLDLDFEISKEDFEYLRTVEL